MISVILGAGFSHIGGVPLTSQLFDSVPTVDRITRQHLVERVLSGWESWRAMSQGGSEQYLNYLEQQGGLAWRDAQWYVALVIALKMGNVELVGARPTITRHSLATTTQVEAHESFWSTIFSRTTDVAVITLNWDILIERGLRPAPLVRKPRPGFHYGDGPELLPGGGYPSYSHIRPICAEGRVPIYKLHGSVSWSLRGGELTRYHDCRPAIRGDAAILAPVEDKQVPMFLQRTWEQAADSLARSSTWIVVGYSLPHYDIAVRNLLRNNASHAPQVHVFNPSDRAVLALRGLLHTRSLVTHHSGLPDCLQVLGDVVDQAIRAC